MTEVKRGKKEQALKTVEPKKETEELNWKKAARGATAGTEQEEFTIEKAAKVIAANDATVAELLKPAPPTEPKVEEKRAKKSYYKPRAKAETVPETQAPETQKMVDTIGQCLEDVTDAFEKDTADCTPAELQRFVALLRADVKAHENLRFLMEEKQRARMEGVAIGVRTVLETIGGI